MDGFGSMCGQSTSPQAAPISRARVSPQWQSGSLRYEVQQLLCCRTPSLNSAHPPTPINSTSVVISWGGRLLQANSTSMRSVWGEFEANSSASISGLRGVRLGVSVSSLGLGG